MPIAKRVYRLLERRQKQAFVLILCIMAVSAGLTQFTPKAIGFLTDDILRQDGLAFGSILPVLLAILLVTVANELLKIGRRVMVEDVATKTEKKARGLVIASLLQAPLAFFKENMTGNIHGRLNRCLEGTVKLEKLLFMDFAPAVFNSVAAVAVILTTLPAGLAPPMLLVVPIGIAIVARQIATQRGIRVELLNGIEVIRILDSAAQEGERFEGKSEFLRKKEMRHHLQMAKYDCLKFLNQALFTVLMIGISVWLAARQVISAGDVLTAYLCFNQLLKPLEELHRILDELSESLVLAEDFFRMAEIPRDFSYLPPTLPAAAAGAAGSALEARGLEFSYGADKPVLRGLTFTVGQGEFVGIAGPSGCGKSSLIKAICKLEACQGEIFIDGKDLRAYSRSELAETIALVPQNPFLIAGTLRENICYGLKRQPADPEVRQAPAKARRLEFVDSLPGGLNAPVAEGGANLSGGQKQRVAIARVFLRRPKILILDEATSALDNTAERAVQAAIEELVRGRGMTVISIAHRLTTLQNADRILVMDGGRIVQCGGYGELIAGAGIFQDMYYGRLK